MADSSTSSIVQSGEPAAIVRKVLPLQAFKFQ